MEVDTHCFHCLKSTMLCFCLIMFCSFLITFICTKPNTQLTDCVKRGLCLKPKMFLYCMTAMLNLRYIISTSIIMISYNTCKFRFLSHSRLVACNVCENIYHVKCISLIPTEQEPILKDVSRSWMCRECHKSLFPFNWMDDEEFMGVVNANEYRQ